MTSQKQEEGPLREQLCALGRSLYERQLVVAKEGNLSVRLPGDQVLCTPAGASLGRLQPEQLCRVTLQGEPVEGRPTSELLLHLEIYRARSDVHAVVHTHAPHATAFAITGVPVPRGGTAEAQQLLGALPTVPFQLPGTRALAESVLPYLQQTNGCLLANHGLVTYAKTLEAAHDLTEMAEAYCRTLLLARQLGPLQPLNEG